MAVNDYESPLNNNDQFYTSITINSEGNIVMKKFQQLPVLIEVMLKLMIIHQLVIVMVIIQEDIVN
jgi:hypothetical protein